MHAGAPMRALLTALDAWVRDGREPPPSRVPLRQTGTLVEAADAVPAIPGLFYAAIHTVAARMDQTRLPAIEIGRYPVFVPRADQDGMAIGGIRVPLLDAPRASYTGWNPRVEGYGPGTLYPLQGGVLPFAPTRAARDEARDPRLSLEERYPTPAAYLSAVRDTAQRLLADRLLLAEDVAAIMNAAEAGTLDRSALMR